MTSNDFNSKKEFYQRSDVARDYDWVRFGRGAGRMVHAIESRTIAELLRKSGWSPGRLILDCPVGSGRLIPMLQTELQARVDGVDRSATMLEIARRHGPLSLQEAEASSLPFTDRRFDAVVSSRFFFHFRDPRSFVCEFARVLKPGGVLVFDTLQWSPRSWIPASFQKGWGGQLFCQSRCDVEGWALEFGLDLLDQSRAFVLPTQVYTWLPESLGVGIEAFGRRWKSCPMSKNYWILRKK